MRFDGALALAVTVACVCAAASQDANKGVSITLTADWPVRPRMTTRDAIASPAARSSVVVLSRLPPSPSPRRFLSTFADALRPFSRVPGDVHAPRDGRILRGREPGRDWSFVDAWSESDAVDCQAQILDAARSLAPSDESHKALRLSLGIRKYSPASSFSGPSATIPPARRRRRVARLSSGTDPPPTSTSSTPSSTTPSPGVPSAAVHPARLPARPRVPHEYHHTGDRTPARRVLRGDGNPLFRRDAPRAPARGGGGPGLRDAQTDARRGVRRGRCVGFGASADRLVAAGYGVEMAIKNMEYKATDDARVRDGVASSSSDSGAGAEPLAEEDVRGFNCASRGPIPGSHSRADIFRDHLAAMDSREETLKVWDIKEFGCRRRNASSTRTIPCR